MTGRKHTCSRLRHRLTLQEEVRTADGAGGYVKTWSDIADLWAEIMPMANIYGREVPFAGQLQSEVSHRIVIRYRADMTPAMRLVFENRAFNILQITDPEEKHEHLTLLVKEGIAS